MPKRIVALPRTAGMEFDIVSYGRRGPGGSSRLSVEQIERTVSRVPEVMVKVSGGAPDSAGTEDRYSKRRGERSCGRVRAFRCLADQRSCWLSSRGRSCGSHAAPRWC